MTTPTFEPPTPHAVAERSRLGAAFSAGVATYPVGLGVLATWALIEWLAAPSSIRPVDVDVAVAVVVAVVALTVLGHVLAHRRLVRRGELVRSRRRVARVVSAAYLPAAVALVGMGLDGNVLAVAAGALAMTSPGVHWVVLDGSPPARAVVRVLVAAVATAAAVPIGYVVGFAAFFVSTMIGSFVFGFLAGHLTTFVPLVLIGPGPNRVGPVVGTEG